MQCHLMESFGSQWFMIKFFWGGGVVDGEGVAVKDALSGVVGVRDLSKNILKQGDGKGKSCS